MTSNEYYFNERNFLKNHFKKKLSRLEIFF